MQRTPEPELMNELDQAIAYAHANFEAPHQAFIQQLQTSFPTLAPTGYALDLGCGPGDITFRFATAFPHWSVHGIDGAAEMLRLARQNLQSRSVLLQISFHQIYIPTQSLPRTAYDLIFSNSLLHHLANPLDLWRSLLQYSHSQTPIFVMDLLRPDSIQAAEALMNRYAQGEPEVLRQDFYNSLLAAYTLDEIHEQLQQMQLHHLELRAVSDRHWIAWGCPHPPRPSA